MKNWLKEILKDFNSLSIEERIEKLNTSTEHEIILTMKAIERTMADGIINPVDLINFLLPPTLSGITEVEPDLFIDFNLESSAANDERFALAA